MENNQQMTVQERVQVNTYTTAQNTKYYTAVITLGVVAIVLFLGLWQVRDKLIWVGYVALAVVGVALLAIMWVIVVWALRFTTRLTSHDIGEHGTVLATATGHKHYYAPAAPAAVRISSSRERARSGKTTVTPVLPSIVDLVEQEFINADSNALLIGYTQGGTPVWDDWQGAAGVGGKGRSGKSRRVIGSIIQAIVQGKKITICDPHGGGAKKDSLLKMLTPLLPWIYRVACTPDDIVAASREYDDAMRSALETPVPDGEDSPVTPWMIVYDEWSHLMLDPRMEDDDRELIKDTVQNSSREYAGVGGSAWIIGQEWTQEACGGANIRKNLFVAFIHNMSAEYAAFFLRAKKWYIQAEELRQGECIYKPYSASDIQRVLTYRVPDDAPALVAEWLKSQGVEPVAQYREVAGSVQPRELPPVDADQVPQLPRPAGRETGPLNNSVSPDHNARRLDLGDLYEQLARLNLLSSPPETPSEVTAKNEPREQAPNSSGELFNGPRVQQPPRGWSQEVEDSIVNTALALHKKGGKVTRLAIMDALGWNRGQWDLIKFVCDKRGINA